VDSELEVFNRVLENEISSGLNYLSLTGGSVDTVGNYTRIGFGGPNDRAKYNLVSSTYARKMCNMLSHVFSYASESAHWYRNTVLYAFFPTSVVGSTKESVLAYLKNLVTAGTPLTFWIPLATPQTYTLTAQQIKALKGDNNVWTDCGDTLSATYKVDAPLETLTAEGVPPLVLSYPNGKPLKAWSVDVLPYQEGTGDPSPSNVRPIYGTDKLTITTAGKNLFDQSQIGEASGITQNAEGYYTGVRSVWNIAFGAGFPRQPTFKPNTQYTISVLGYNDSSTSSTQIGFKYTDGTASYLLINSTTPDTFTLTTTAGKTVSFILGTFGSEGTVTFFIKDIMLVEGTSAEPYEPYNASQTVITLPQTVYTGTIGSEGGESRSGMIVLNGVENWAGEPSYGFYYPEYRMKKLSNYSNTMMCETLKVCNNNASGFRNTDYAITGYNDPQGRYPNDNWIYVRVRDVTSVAGLKAWLAENPVTVVYELATPTTFAVPSVTIPTPTGSATTWATAEDGTVDSMSVTYKGHVMPE